jgi:hypothetical protein
MKFDFLKRKSWSLWREYVIFNLRKSEKFQILFFIRGSEILIGLIQRIFFKGTLIFDPKNKYNQKSFDKRNRSSSVWPHRYFKVSRPLEPVCLTYYQTHISLSPKTKFSLNFFSDVCRLEQLIRFEIQLKSD